MAAGAFHVYRPSLTLYSCEPKLTHLIMPSIYFQSKVLIKRREPKAVCPRKLHLCSLEDDKRDDNKTRMNRLLVFENMQEQITAQLCATLFTLYIPDDSAVYFRPSAVGSSRIVETFRFSLVLIQSQ